MASPLHAQNVCSFVFEEDGNYRKFSFSNPSLIYMKGKSVLFFVLVIISLFFRVI